MSVYIEKDIAIKQLDNLKDNDSSGYDLGLDAAINEIKHHMPTADVRENVYGEWVLDHPSQLWECTNCHGREIRTTDFCPKCGAYMISIGELKMMDDVIRRQDAIDAVNVSNLHRGIIDALQSILEELPSAQPEIIRCKDCKWKQGAECVRFADVRPFSDDFCSRAERRNDDDRQSP